MIKQEVERDGELLNMLWFNSLTQTVAPTPPHTFRRRNSGLSAEHMRSLAASQRRQRSWVPPVIDPLSRGRMLYEGFISVFIVWGAIEIPFSVTFLNPSDVLTALDATIDSIMCIDVIVTFFTGYVDADDHVTMERGAIAKHCARHQSEPALLSCHSF